MERREAKHARFSVRCPLPPHIAPVLNCSVKVDLKGVPSPHRSSLELFCEGCSQRYPLPHHTALLLSSFNQEGAPSHHFTSLFFQPVLNFLTCPSHMAVLRLSFLGLLSFSTFFRLLNCPKSSTFYQLCAWFHTLKILIFDYLRKLNKTSFFRTFPHIYHPCFCSLSVPHDSFNLSNTKQNRQLYSIVVAILQSKLENGDKKLKNGDKKLEKSEKILENGDKYFRTVTKY